MAIKLEEVKIASVQIPKDLLPLEKKCNVLHYIQAVGTICSAEEDKYLITIALVEDVNGVIKRELDKGSYMFSVEKDIRDLTRMFGTILKLESLSSSYKDYYLIEVGEGEYPADKIIKLY